MTVRIAHSSHQWDYRRAECRLCQCASASREATMLCLKAPLAAPAPKQVPRTPSIYAASFAGAKDLVRE